VTAQTKPRKATPPRKAARPRANGQAPTNGVPPAAPPGPEVPPPEEFVVTTVETTEQVELPPGVPTLPTVDLSAIEHPYGDKPVYVFSPREVKPGDSMDPIVLPHISTLEADVEFFWEIDELDPMHQSFAYMRRANIPRDIQRRVVRLPEDEMGRLLRAWFMGIVTPQGVGPPGES
jgi:hypothetical protein